MDNRYFLNPTHGVSRKGPHHTVTHESGEHVSSFGASTNVAEGLLAVEAILDVTCHARQHRYLASAA